MYDSFQQTVASLCVTARVLYIRRLASVFRLTTDQTVMSLGSASPRSNLRHLVMFGAEPQRCWVKPTPWVSARGCLTDRNIPELHELHVCVQRVQRRQIPAVQLIKADGILAIIRNVKTKTS